MKVIRRDDPPRDPNPHQLSFGSGPLGKAYFFYEKNTGVSHFHIGAAQDGQFPVEEAANVLAMHCMVRGSSPRDYVVMVEAAREALEGLALRLTFVTHRDTKVRRRPLGRRRSRGRGRRGG